ncbi:hypothetical protein [Salipiger abyssi]|uniref:Uncharacterized protein n=1 Tax=Salipiger abyssi TaxID=1250539 RepID=A0A1P8UPC6_9RHOB|nr:hypothetical protein [Salipiger abyssi]APZ51221.1 hypothetical protein Ga0080574_TMP887 [Salipiger abyssi]
MQKLKFAIMAVSAVLIFEMGLALFLTIDLRRQVSGLKDAISLPDQINQNLAEMIRAARADSGTE